MALYLNCAPGQTGPLLTAEALAVERAAAEDAADRNMAALLDEHPDLLSTLGPQAMRVVGSNASVRSKLGRLRTLADRVAAALAPMRCADRGALPVATSRWCLARRRPARSRQRWAFAH